MLLACGESIAETIGIVVMVLGLLALMAFLFTRAS